MKLVFAQISMAISAGLAVGIFSGMSSTPIAGALVASLFSIAPAVALVYSGAVSGKNLAASMRKFFRLSVSVAATAFLIALICGVFAGIFARQTNWFLPSPYKAEVQDLVAAGYSKERALEIFSSRFASGVAIENANSIQFGQLSGSPLCKEPPAQTARDYSRVVKLISEESEELAKVISVAKVDAVISRLISEGVIEEKDRPVASLIYVEGLWHAFCSD